MYEGPVPIPEPRAVLKDEDPVGWAVRAALQDSCYLISPRARRAAIDILWEAPATKENLAALMILRDGGVQQGAEGRYAQSSSLDGWTQAAATLEFFV